jgi:hypothetical protein
MPVLVHAHLPLCIYTHHRAMAKTPPTVIGKRTASKPTGIARLNCIIPADLHRRVKVGCATEGVNMTDVVIEFLEGRFPAPKADKLA